MSQKRAGFVWASVAAVAVVGGAPRSEATVYFTNSGTVPGNFATVVAEHNGSVTQVTDVKYQGTTAIQCRQIYDPNYAGLYHSEVHVGNQIAHTGQDKYFAWTFRLQPNWEFVSEYFTLGQWGMSTGNCKGPITMLWVRVDQSLRFTTKPSCDGSLPSAGFNLPAISPGVWHRYVHRWKLRADSTGYLQAWLNGTSVASYTGQNNPYDGDIAFNLGLYASQWNDGMQSGTQGDRSVWIDEIRVTSTLAEAEPNNTSGSTPTPTPAPTNTPAPTATPVPTATPGGGFSGYYRLMARHSGKAVVVLSASTAAGADVIQYSYSATGPNDEWELRGIGGGYYRVINRNSGLDLNVSGASTANGGDVIQWGYTANAVYNDEWQPASLGNGYYRIVARHSGRVLNVSGASTANGANVDQWSWANVAQQQFDIVSVP